MKYEYDVVKFNEDVGILLGNDRGFISTAGKSVGP